MATKFGTEGNNLVVELECEFLISFNFVSEEGFANLQKLLGNHRQHLDLNSVELIETGPSSSLAETREESSHQNEIDLIRAIEHNAKNGNGFGQILGRLSLTGTSRAGGVSTELNVKGTSNGNPASVGQGGDNKTGSGTHVLTTVVQSGLNLLDNATVIRVFFVVVSELFLPIEVEN
jgi:hypothetical protein